MSNINGGHNSNNKINTSSTNTNSHNTRNIPSTISLNSFQTINKNTFNSQQLQYAPLITNASISNTNNHTEIEYSGILFFTFCSF
jgi:hypothetical protein